MLGLALVLGLWVAALAGVSALMLRGDGSDERRAVVEDSGRRGEISMQELLVEGPPGTSRP